MEELFIYYNMLHSLYYYAILSKLALLCFVHFFPRSSDGKKKKWLWLFTIFLNITNTRLFVRIRDSERVLSGRANAAERAEGFLKSSRSWLDPPPCFVFAKRRTRIQRWALLRIWRTQRRFMKTFFGLSDWELLNKLRPFSRFLHYY